MPNAKAVIIDEQDVEYSSTLTKRDIGKSAVMSNGCFHFRETHKEAEELAKFLNE